MLFWELLVLGRTGTVEEPSGQTGTGTFAVENGQRQA